MREWIAQRRYLRQIGRRLRLAHDVETEDLRALFENALATQDVVAVIETTVATVARAEFAGNPIVDDVFIPCLQFLSDRKDARWLNDAWFQRSSRAFFQALTEPQTQATLENLVYCPKISWHIEEVLAALAANNHDPVWQFFRQRLDYEPQAEAQRYEAIPYEFHEPAAALCNNPERAVDIVRSWDDADDPLFRYHGGRLLAIAFPNIPERFEAKLIALLKAEGDRAFRFVAGIMENYHGEPFTHRVCQALIEVVPENDDRLGSVEVALMSTGVVSGEFGMVEAYQAKKDAISAWLEDPRPKVRTFAGQYSRMLDNRIASEQEHAEGRRAMRRLDFQGDEAA